MIGDSITKGVRKQEINRRVRYMNTYVKSFPGAPTDDMESYIIPTVKREPDYVIVHYGTNDPRTDEPEIKPKRSQNLLIFQRKPSQMWLCLAFWHEGTRI